MKTIIKCLSTIPGVSLEAVRWVKFVLNIIPILLVVFVKIWAYSVFVVDWNFALFMNGHIKSGLAFFLTYHLLALLTMWSFFRCVLSRPPLIVSRESGEYYSNTSQHHLYEEEDKFCNRCQRSKPQRAHHCTWCERCVAKMDHHCPWLGNCVGYHNYKFFILMLGYTMVFCLFVAITMSVNQYGLKRVPSYYTIAAVGFALAGGTGMLFSFHIYLLFTNKTTIECGINVASCAQHPYDLGWKRNVVTVMGQDPLFWLLPIRPKEQGDKQPRSMESSPLVVVTSTEVAEV